MGTVPVPHVWTTGEVATASNLNNNDQTVANFLLNVPYTKVRQTSGQSVGVFTALSWNTADVNSDNSWSATNPTRFTANTPGWYETSGKFELATGATTGRRGLTPAVNGTQLNGGQTMLASATVSGSGILPDFPLFLNANDYLELQAYQDAGSFSTASGGTITQAWGKFRWVHS